MSRPGETSAVATPGSRRRDSIVPVILLKARALRWLAQREQSRFELGRKLLPYAVAQCATEHLALEAVQRSGAMGGGCARPATPSPGDPRERVEALLAELQVEGCLSDDRFVESRVNARRGRFGNLRIRRELQQHALKLPVELADALAATELDRARALRERRFGDPPGDPAARARQSRFLAGRGFSAEVIGRVLRSGKSAAVVGQDDAGEHD